MVPTPSRAFAISGEISVTAFPTSVPYALSRQSLAQSGVAGAAPLLAAPKAAAAGVGGAFAFRAIGTLDNVGQWWWSESQRTRDRVREARRMASGANVRCD
jgi:hypothetical protein